MFSGFANLLVCVHTFASFPDFPLLALCSGNEELVHSNTTTRAIAHSTVLLCCMLALTRGNSTPELHQRRLRPVPPQLVSRLGEGGV